MLFTTTGYDLAVEKLIQAAKSRPNERRELELRLDYAYDRLEADPDLGGYLGRKDGKEVFRYIPGTVLWQGHRRQVSLLYVKVNTPAGVELRLWDIDLEGRHNW
jgi:hypothetical protein